MTERTAHETQISVRLGPITGLCRLCRVCPDRAERGAKGRREWAWMGLWGLFWAFLLYYGPLSRITRSANFKHKGSYCTFTSCARSCAQPSTLQR